MIREKFENHNLVLQVQREFAELKKENLEKKARGRRYDPHFDALLPENISEEEAELWSKFKQIKDENDAEKFAEQLHEYGEKITREFVEKYGEANLDALITDPKQAFLGFLGNQITIRRLESYKKKLKK